jgi:hypothetical protein
MAQCCGKGVVTLVFGEGSVERCENIERSDNMKVSTMTRGNHRYGVGGIA